jgi:hypothetical protein
MSEFLSYRIERLVFGPRLIIEARKGDLFFTIQCDAPLTFEGVFPLIETLKRIGDAQATEFEFGDSHRTSQPASSGRRPMKLTDLLAGDRPYEFINGVKVYRSYEDYCDD